MAVDAKLIKQLREGTGARMKDCVEALKVSEGDYEGAIAHLRKKNLAAGAKAAGRSAEEGTIGYKVADDDSSLVVVQLSANTDFVVKNDEFQALLKNLLSVTETSGADSAEELLEKELDGRKISEVVKELAGKIGENIAVQKVKRVEGSFGFYFHHDAKQGAAVQLEGVAGEEARELGKDLAMHVVFAKPKYLTREEVSQEEIDKEKAIITERLKTDPKNAKKPAEILDKIASGQINKFFGQICLMDQPYYRPEVKKTVAQVLKEKSAEAKIKGFEHFLIGVA